MAKGKKKGREIASGPLADSPSHLLHRVLQVALDIYAVETGGTVTQRQYAVLTAVALNEGLTQTDLVRATGIDRSTLADLVARMIGKGLLERERSNLDARANTVRLTEAGRAELDRERPKVEAADVKILSLVARGKREALLKLLRDVAAAGEALRDEDATESKARKKDKAAKKAEKAEKAAAKGDKAKPDKPAKPDKKKKKKAKAGAEPAETAEPVPAAAED